MRSPFLAPFTLLAGLAPVVLARQPSDWLDAAQKFSDDFLYPANGAIAASGKYSAFQADVKGRVDVTTAFLGDELNVEYIFGLFSQVTRENAQQQDTFLLPVPTAGELQELAIQDNVVSLSNIIEFSYFKQNLSLPIQVDAWFEFNRETGQMAQYDVTFRRWAWFWKVAIPLLTPDLEKENNVTAGSMLQEDLLTLHAARHICSEHAIYCTDPAHRQYDSPAECLDFLTHNRTFGEPFELGQDTTGCRYMHTAMLKYRPDEHCPHVGPSGGKMCVARDYTEVVRQKLYDNTWIAPASNLPSSLEGISAESQQELLKAGMMVVGPMTFGWVPCVAILYVSACGVQANDQFLLLWVSALVSRVLLKRTKVFNTLPWALQRTTVVYVMSILYTSIALALQLVSIPIIWYSYDQRSITCARFAAVVICGLYIFELTYRDTIRIPLLAHHLITVFCIIWLIYCMDKLRHPSLITTGTVWLFQATLEQVVFLGLLSYRLQWSTTLTRFCLGPGALVSLVLKLSAAVWLLVIWGTKQRHYDEPTDIAFTVILWIAVPCLLLAQVWGAWACWCVGRSAARKLQPINTALGSASDLVVSPAESVGEKDSRVDVSTPTLMSPVSPISPYREQAPNHGPMPTLLATLTSPV